ncbi:OPT oligopeptide transporter protein-domain-containing protein [Mycena latifolia]|nr:OPT oligopeptide transporter protein-domain-containing protein [Mycena latifolia]
MNSLTHEHILPRDPQILVVDEKLLQEDDDPIKSDARSVSLEDAPDRDSQYDWDSEDSRDIPELVRSIVSFEDDPSLPVTTFRSVSISLFFIVLGSIVSQIGFFRTTTTSFSVFFVILVSDPIGRFMARTLPTYTVPLGRYSFSLNPGPWSPKEHALVGIAANAGTQGQWATYLPTNAKLYYGIDYHPAVALFFGWGSALIGFSFAAMCRQLLIYDPTYIFPLSLQQVTLYRSMEQNEFVFPFTASLAPLCWFASRNHTANFLGSGIGGVALLNITLDWSNITSSVITFPYSVQLIVFAAFVITTWLLIPIAYFGNLWGSPTYNIMSNGLFTKNGSSYPFSSLLSVVDGQQYDEVGLAYAGAQYMWNIFFWYASYISAFVWFGLFVRPKLVHIYKARRARKSAHVDRLTKLIEANYKDITLYEWIALFMIPFIVLLVVVIKGGIYMPLFTYFIGLLFGGAATLPMASIYALSGFMLKVGLFNELVYGYMIVRSSATLVFPVCDPGILFRTGSRAHPGTRSASSHIGSYLGEGDDCYPVLEDQKIGHYLHLPPRQVIGIQITAAFVGLPVNSLLTIHSLQTAQDFKSYNTAGIQYALVGPTRLFANSVYHPLTYGFVVGAVAPLLIWLAHRKFPRWSLDKCNTTIFFASSATFRGNISTGPFTSILIGTVWNFWLFRYRHQLWKMWAYISGAALDTGFNANLLFIFVAFGSSGITMANWWGNNASSTEHLYPAGLLAHLKISAAEFYSPFPNREYPLPNRHRHPRQQDHTTSNLFVSHPTTIAMNPDPVAQPGYESDTGPRDNPTCANFVRKEPVKKVIVVGRSKKVLNRTGRAICRIVHPHGWSITSIALIFGVSHTSIARAIDNVKYLPRDNTAEDYDRVDPEFKTMFPPLGVTLPPPTTSPGAIDIDIDTSDEEDRDESLGGSDLRSSGRPSRAAKSRFYSQLGQSDSDDEPRKPAIESTHTSTISRGAADPLPIPQKRSHEESSAPDAAGGSGSSSGPTTQTPASASAAKRLRLEQEVGQPQSVSGRPASLGGTTISPSAPQSRPARSIFAAFQSRSQAIQSPGSSSITPTHPLPPPAITQARSTSASLQPTQVSAPLPKRSPLPPPLPKSQAPTTPLLLFLKNILGGTDLSAHHALLVAQGFTMPRLLVVATWRRTAIAEALSRLLMGSGSALGGRRGLNAVEVISLEVAIGKLKPDKQSSSTVLPPVNAKNSTPTLASFLQNALGFDLSAHAPLLATQGLDLTYLRSMATWDRRDLQEVLQRTLPPDDGAGVGGRKDMTALELVALEFAIRELKG